MASAVEKLTTKLEEVEQDFKDGKIYIFLSLRQVVKICNIIV